MAEEITYVDVSEVREGKLDELKKALNELVEFVKVNESLPFAYNFYFNHDNTRMTLIQVHPNSVSLELHLQVAGSIFPKFASFIKMRSIEIYGKASQSVLMQLNKKVEMLGGTTLQMHQFQAGFSRLGRNAT